MNLKNGSVSHIPCDTSFLTPLNFVYLPLYHFSNSCLLVFPFNNLFSPTSLLYKCLQTWWNHKDFCFKDYCRTSAMQDNGYMQNSFEYQGHRQEQYSILRRKQSVLYTNCNWTLVFASSKMPSLASLLYFILVLAHGQWKSTANLL